MNPSSFIPAEILEIIFSYYGPDDRDLLRACCLASQALLWPAQAKLFASVDLIRPQRSRRAYTAFKNVTTGSNRLAHCVIALGVDIGDREGLQKLSDWGVLALLPNVRHVTIARPNRLTTRSWITEEGNEAKNTDRGEFIHDLRSHIFPQLWTIQLRSIGLVDLRDIALSCPQLHSLTCDNVSFGRHWNPGTVPSFPATLRSLTVDDLSAREKMWSENNIPHLVGLIKSGKLESLILTDLDRSDLVFRRQSHLSWCRATLIHLDMGLTLEIHLRMYFFLLLYLGSQYHKIIFSGSYREKLTFPELQMSEFKKLRTFSAMFTAQYSYLVLNWFEHACPEPWTIEELTLDLYTDEKHNIELNPKFDWFDFDSMLVSRAWMIFGEKFVGYVMLTVPDNIPLEQRFHIRRAMAEALPKASERGMVRFGLRCIESRWMGSTLYGTGCN
ncbi:hypothetical protein DL96DRAFT_370463 [Flagelloscypha sp. PMI_526]|nr:hypothetical protein DL96DRAFT_370463 [Flagelloscypha sp. PMI_526]